MAAPAIGQRRLWLPPTGTFDIDWSHPMAAGLKLWQLAARAGIPQGRISELENDRRPGTPTEWERLRTALGQSGDAPGTA